MKRNNGKPISSSRCEHLSNDKRFITRDNRKKYRKELKIELEKFLSKKQQ